MIICFHRARRSSSVSAFTSIIFHGSFSNLVRTFIALRSGISDKVDYEGSASLNIHKMYHFIELGSFAIPGLIIQDKVTKFSTNVGLNIDINASSWFLPLGLSCGKGIVVACVWSSVCPSVNFTLSSQVWAGITKFAPNMHPGILSTGIENGEQGWNSCSSVVMIKKYTSLYKTLGSQRKLVCFQSTFFNYVR